MSGNRIAWLAWLALGCGPSATTPDASDVAETSPDVDDAELPDRADAETPDGDAAEADGEDAPSEGDGDAEVEWGSWDGDAPDQPRMTKDEHIASCLRTRSCFPENAQQLATCTSAFAHVNGRPIGAVLSWVARCVNAAGSDCAAVRRCMTNGEEATPCVPLSTADRCDGTVLRQCSRASSLDFVFDCANLDLECFLDTDGVAACGLGTCDPDAFRWTCRGSTVVSCDLGVISLAQCDAAGMTCVEDASGGRCAGTGAACTDASDPRRCEAGRVRGCLGGTSADIDCDAVVPEWVCGDRDGAAGCVPPGDECTAVPLFGSDIDEFCDGVNVMSCLDGWVRAFVCAEYGLGPCTVVPPGHAARCTEP